MSVPIPSPLWHTKTFLFDRGGEEEYFTERDRLVLDLLQPHLVATWEAARTRRLVRATLAELDHSDATSSRGVVFLNVVGDVEFASESARRLLQEYFGAAGGAMLPRDLAEWVASGTGSLVRRQGAGMLTVDRADETMILRERADGGGAHCARARSSRVGRPRQDESGDRRAPVGLAEHGAQAPRECLRQARRRHEDVAVTRFLGLLDAEAS